MNILITGISGFVGTNIIAYFKNDPSITIIGHSRKKNLKKNENGIKYIDDLSLSALNNFSIDVIIHLAGIAHDLIGKYSEKEYDDVNHKATCSLFQTFLSSNATKFIFVSSIKAVVDFSDSPVDEKATPNPSTPYGQSKLKAEQFIISQNHERKKVYILRPCMIHGAGNKGNLNALVKFVKIGFPFPLGAFKNQRSFLSIENFCFITHRLLTSNAEPGIYHLADDGYLSTVDLINLIGEEVKKTVRIWRLPQIIIRIFFSFKLKYILVKLTENMMVENKKIVSTLQIELPLSIKDGLRKTVRSLQ